MKYTTIRIEGAILSADILDKIEQGDISGQIAKEFGFDAKTKVKDEIARAWADAQDLWRIFNRQKEKVADEEYGTSETRRYWMVPFLGLLGYDVQLSKAEFINGKSYAVSHRAENLNGFPVHVVGFNDSLDKKRDAGGTRMSPHALLQEYINLNEHLYAIVTNGIHLRLLRDSSRLIKLSFVEFDLQTMMDEEHFADFAIMYRLLHISRMPVKIDMGAESLIEKYHQDALESGSRIRDGLSRAVEFSIRSLANGFLEHPDNEELREKIENGEISFADYYQYQLRLIYRILFLLVIEERNLIFPENSNKAEREIYRDYYSVNRLRRLSDKPYILEQRYNDLWIGFKHTFQLFETEAKGKHLGIKPLSGDLFGYHAIGFLNQCNLENRILLECVKNLSVFHNKNTGQKMRVNYAALNVEEFGSVYEGLLEYEPAITSQGGSYQFDLIKGSERSSSGSHYTPDELVQPLIKHSLDHIIKDKLKSSDKPLEKEQALLSIKVCDVACGSGHILLNAARRIGTELSKVRTGEDQPSPKPLRQAVRDVIKFCIYGVDKNPLAVDLCKVALWLEAHNPGEPLNFLDHHIKCGDAIVGLAHKEELENGIADEAFKKMPEDEKEIRAELAARNKRERKNPKQYSLGFSDFIAGSLKNISKMMTQFNQLPEDTIEQIDHKRKTYENMVSGSNWLKLKNLADIQVAQFFIPKIQENTQRIVTDEEYRDYLNGKKDIPPIQAGKAGGIAAEKRFFHWFLEFPVVFAGGGFDCILGNPPYLGKTALSGTYGYEWLNWVNTYFFPASGCDLVTYFLRRNSSIIKENGFTALITTNSISEGATRESGLGVLLKEGASINFVIRSIKWPGMANLYISLISIVNGHWTKDRLLDNKPVEFISSYFEDFEEIGDPCKLIENENQIFQGTKYLGDGFLLNEEERSKMLNSSVKNGDVIFPLINGKEINDRYDQSYSRYIINFFDWDESKARQFSEPFNRIVQMVKPIREKTSSKSSKESWWIHARRRPGLYKVLSQLKYCFAVACTTKYLNFSMCPSNWIFTHALFIYTNDKFDNFCIVQSTIHNEWARKYSSALKLDLRYSPSNCFVTFPFPQNLSDNSELSLEKIGSDYHEHRRQIMQKMKLGLTRTYNLFHRSGLSVEDVVKASKQPQEICESACKDIIILREFHKQMDETVLQAYGWEDIGLAHDFYAVDYLPENDRIRYTISPDARKEVLKRLLQLNHEIHEQELQEGTPQKSKSKKKQKAADSNQMTLF